MTNSSSGQARVARVSVNLDIANLPAEAAATILREAANHGRVVTARAFADFRRNDLGDLPVQLFQLGFQLIHCPSWPNGGGRLKSVVDSILAQDLRDQAENDPDLDVFILGSGDRDFLAVVHALRRHGRKVIIAATPDASNRSLLATVDGYIQLQAPERHTFNIPAEQLYSPQPPAAVYSGPVTSLPAVSPSAPLMAAAPGRPAVTAPQRPPRRTIERVAPASTAPVAAETPPLSQPVVHPLQPRRQVAPVYRPAVVEPVAAAPAPTVAPTTPVPLTAATLHEQIIQLVQSRPLITPRQVLQALAPRGEPSSARRRQAVGDAIAQLVQQGRLIRRTEVVRGRPADVLLTPEMAAQTPPVLPLEEDLLEVVELAEPAPPAVGPRPLGRARMGERRGAGAAAAPPPTYRAPHLEPEATLEPEPALDFAASEVEVEAPAYQVTVEELPAWTPETAETVEVPFEPEPGVETLPVPGPAPAPMAAGRSVPVGRRGAVAAGRRPTTIEPVRPTSRFRAPVFTHVPEVAEAAGTEEAASVAPAAVTPAPVTAEHAALPDMTATAPAAPVEAAPAAEASASPEAVAEAPAQEDAAGTPARPRRRSRRRTSTTGRSETAQQHGSAADAAGEVAPAS